MGFPTVSTVKTLGSLSNTKNLPAILTNNAIALNSPNFNLGALATVIGGHKLIDWMYRHDKVERGRLHKGFGLIFGQGLSGLPRGDLWTKYRKAINPLVRSDAIRQYLPHIHSIANDFIGKFEDGTHEDLGPALSIMTLNIIMGIMIQINNSEVHDQLIADVPELFSTLRFVTTRGLAEGILGKTVGSVASMLPDLGASQRTLRGKRETVYAVLLKQLKSDNSMNKLINHLRAVEDENGEKLTDKEIVDQILAMMVGGFDTTAATSKVFTWYLAAYPELQERIYQEALQCQQDLTLLQDMPVYSALYSQVMALFSPAFMVPRDTTGEVVIPAELSGINVEVVIPEGKTLLLAPPVGTWFYLRQKDLPLLPPFSGEYAAHTQKVAGPSGIQFGAAQQKCVGMNLANPELAIVVGTLLLNWFIELGSNAEFKFGFHSVFEPEYTPVQLTRRSQS